MACVECFRKNKSFSKYPHKPPFEAMLSVFFLSGLTNSRQDGFARAVDTNKVNRMHCKKMQIFLVLKISHLCKSIGFIDQIFLCFPFLE